MDSKGLVDIIEVLRAERDSKEKPDNDWVGRQAQVKFGKKGAYNNGMILGNFEGRKEAFDKAIEIIKQYI